MLTTDESRPWTFTEKIVFRFLFLFIGFYLLNYETVFISFDFHFFDRLSTIYGFFGPLLHWFDAHVYHTGYNPKHHESLPGDNHFGLAFYFTWIIFSIIVVTAWSVIDRRKTQYNRLYYWFRLYVRYMVALIMFGYGVDKLIPSQMRYPGVVELLTPVGNQDLFSTLWNFVGASPGYEMFTGTCEVIGSLLLIFRRTYIFGGIFMCTILCNVVALNIFYNVGVKIYSFLLLVCVLFLLAPYARKLINFFFYGRSVTLSERHYRFERNWKKYLVIALGIGIPLAGFLDNVFQVGKIYSQNELNSKRQKLYDVTYFITSDTLQPLLTDTLRWKRFALAYKKSAVIYNMQDKADIYDCDIDTLKRTYVLHSGADTSTRHVFHYSFPQKDVLQLSGTWKGNDVRILMKEVSIDSMNLTKEHLVFLDD